MSLLRGPAKFRFRPHSERPSLRRAGLVGARGLRDARPLAASESWLFFWETLANLARMGAPFQRHTHVDRFFERERDTHETRPGLPKRETPRRANPRTVAGIARGSLSLSLSLFDLMGGVLGLPHGPHVIRVSPVLFRVLCPFKTQRTCFTICAGFTTASAVLIATSPRAAFRKKEKKDWRKRIFSTRVVRSQAQHAVGLSVKAASRAKTLASKFAPLVCASSGPFQFTH